MKEELRRSRLGSSGQWRRVVWMGMLKAAKNDPKFKAHLKRFFRAGLKHKEVIRRVKEKYLSNLLIRQLELEERIKEFPYDTKRRTASGEIAKPKIKFAFKTLRRRLSILEKEEMLLDLNLRSWDDICPHLNWFTTIEEKEKGGEGGREKAGRSSNPKAGHRGNNRGRQRENGNIGGSFVQGSSGSSGQRGQHPVCYCNTCGRKHKGECWAKKKNIECRDCGEKGQYAGAPACKKKGGSFSSSGGGKGD
uniref:Uncharacterized protein n=1 Tax=Chromera velia CCMP2878 TaxID=1169474 RepID=A0A0G4G5E8_9ALVE|eukprot:Cvel_551.t1-p1 / transcript=Cvel_551.t1 / gene=Cvel_551 / organism=Chromera_velia_CCMP2878 / gene_product=hypothetical protein / transcript_product=hypothetical protein / location=Cvel_scaffold17:74352-75219(-) / protein_length=248 / sequence_SO=supercontig / SO=protein_coding / is_pseudo=false